MTVPQFLKAGDQVAIIATARKISRSEITPAVEKLQSWGLRVITGPHLHDEMNQFAGSDDARAADLQWALDDPAIRAVIIARGGYGTLRIVDKINLDGFRKHPKWLAGYSDVTVLHSHLECAGYATLHATMPINFLRDEASTDSLRRALLGERISYSTAPHPLNRPGRASSTVTGGNLSLLYALSGSVSVPATEGKILFIEDLDEYLYHIDRMMLNLKRRGVLKGLAGLVVGGMSDMKDNAVPFGRNAEEIIRECVDEYGFPVCFDFPAGHGTKNMALYLGCQATLDVNAENVTLDY